MKVIRGYKTELDPNNVQRTNLLKHCGAVHDRDFNASKNLEHLAVSSTDSINAYGDEGSDVGLMAT
jgi:transposase